MNIKIKYFNDKLEKLKYIDGKSDWIDLRSAEDIDLKQGEFHLIPLGIAMEIPEGYFGAYMQTYMERDIRELIEIKNESKFLKFIACVASRTGQEVNLTDMGRDVGIDTKTADSWLSLLVTSGLVFLLQPYSGNTIKRIVKRPKLYFMDTGLACYLSLWNDPRVLENSAMAGAMFETYVVSEIIKEYANKGIAVPPNCL